MTHFSFNVAVATKFKDVRISILLQYIQGLDSDEKEDNGEVVRQISYVKEPGLVGGFFVKRSIIEIQNDLPFLSCNQIKSTLNKMLALELIYRRKLEETNMDHTYWWRITPKGNETFLGK